MISDLDYEVSLVATILYVLRLISNTYLNIIMKYFIC